MINAVSNSMLGLWFRCGMAFQFRYLEGLIIPPGIAARRGSAFHKACDENHKQKIDSYQDLPLDHLQDVTRDSYMNLIRDEGIFIPKDDQSAKDRLLNEGLNDAILATKTYREKIASQIQPVETEKYYINDIGLNLPICGIIDVIDSEQVEHDFKTANKRKGSAFFSSAMQPTFYILLRYLRENVMPRFKYHVITVKGELQEEETTRGKQDFNRLILYIQLFLRSLKRGIYKPAEPGHWMCSEKWCGYYGICKYKQ